MVAHAAARSTSARSASLKRGQHDRGQRQTRADRVGVEGLPSLSLSRARRASSLHASVSESSDALPPDAVRVDRHRALDDQARCVVTARLRPRRRAGTIGPSLVGQPARCSSCARSASCCRAAPASGAAASGSSDGFAACAVTRRPNASLDGERARSPAPLPASSATSICARSSRSLGRCRRRDRAARSDSVLVSPVGPAGQATPIAGGAAAAPAHARAAADRCGPPALGPVPDRRVAAEGLHADHRADHVAIDVDVAGADRARGSLRRSRRSASGCRA